MRVLVPLLLIVGMLVCSTATRAETVTLKGSPRNITRLVFSPDGKRIAAGSRYGTVKLWDADLRAVSMAGSANAVRASPSTLV